MYPGYLATLGSISTSHVVVLRFENGAKEAIALSYACKFKRLSTMACDCPLEESHLVAVNHYPGIASMSD